MARHFGNAALMQYATARETRASAIFANKNDMRYYTKKEERKTSRQTGTAVRIGDDGELTPPEDGDEDSDSSGDGEDEEEQDDEDEPEVFAPSELAKRKRGHQTGLSVSLSNTTLGSRKRAHSSSSDDSEDTRRPAKASKFISHETVDSDSSDDDNIYNGVDLISESEGEDDIQRDEEQMIIDSLAEQNSKANRRLQHHRTDSLESWEGFPSDNPTLDEEAPFFTEQIQRSSPGGSISYATGAISDTPTQSRSTRRVRFADDVEDSSSGSSTTSNSDIDNDIFPDIFLSQDKLDPSFRNLIENGNDDGASQTGSEESYWDLDGTDANGANDNNTGTGIGGESITEVDSGEESGFYALLGLLPMLTSARFSR